MERVLVTGAAGFIGSHLCERLLEEGREVVGVDNYDSFYDPGIKRRNLRRARRSDRFAEAELDLRDPDALEELPGDVDAVIHLAARAGVRPSIEDPVLYSSVNVDGTTAVLDWARRNGVGRFVFGSSSSVYGEREEVPFSEEDAVEEPVSPYAATKRAGELLCHTYHHLFDMSVLALRYFTVYGPRQRPDLAIHKFARLLEAGEPIPMYGDGTSERDYTYVDDILDGTVAALAYTAEHPDAWEIVNLGESQTIPLREMIRVIGEEMGVEPEIDRQPSQPGDVERTYADVSKARRLLGYEPSTGFREGIREFVRWFREERAG